MTQLSPDAINLAPNRACDGSSSVYRSHDAVVSPGTETVVVRRCGLQPGREVKPLSRMTRRSGRVTGLPSAIVITCGVVIGGMMYRGVLADAAPYVYFVGSGEISNP